MSHRYCSSSQDSRNGGVTSSMSASEKSVVMFSLVSGAPSARGCGACEISPAGVTRRDSFSTPFLPPRNTVRWPQLTRPARRCSNFLSMTLRIMAQGYQHRRSGQLGDDLDLHQEARIEEPLYLHPGDGGQVLLRVILETQIGNLQQSVHVGGVDGLLDDAIEAHTVGGERALETRIDGAHLTPHVVRRDQSAVGVRCHGARDVEGLVDQDRLRVPEVFLVSI